MEDKLSIKNILFTKSLPNHDVPAAVDGHKIFPCIDCGDKFMFESSYDDHLSRKSMQITYMCRFCNQTKIFFNRCMLLYHIRSHTFKTATINVNDLKIEPLPLNYYKTLPEQTQNSKIIVVSPQRKENQNTAISQKTGSKQQKKIIHDSCNECKERIIVITGTNYKDRAGHYMQYTNEVHTCPVCLFALPTTCGLRAHMRFHLEVPPFFCPECGVNMPNQKRKYPYGHDCDGFKMMRATTRLQCSLEKCGHIYHPNDIVDHLKVNHLKKIYKCQHCVVACFNETTITQHAESHAVVSKPYILFYQCDLCPGKLVFNSDSHLRTHMNSSAQIFPCWACGSTFKDVNQLLAHHLFKHASNETNAIKNMLNVVINRNVADVKRIYKVVKKCELCLRNFTYQCNYYEISVLPNECPYKCSKTRSSFNSILSSEPLLTCHFCKDKIPQNWEEIKKHYALKHKSYKCLDLRVILEKIDIDKYNNKKMRTRNAIKNVKPKKRQPVPKVVHETIKSTDNKLTENDCTMCDTYFQTKDKLETHFLSHKDPCMAYQCMECGHNFVVKPSFATHLMLKHGISNVDEYISKKNQCYNEIALEKNLSSNITLEPLEENQCKICRDRFENCEELDKHFRGHGMAFLLKSTSNKNVS